MSLSTYSDLQTAVANHLHRTDLTSIIPDLISLAETRINGDLDSRKQDSVTTLNTVASQEYVDLPSDFINARAVVDSTNKNTVDYKSPDSIAKEFVGSFTSAPQFYTIVGDKMYFAPVPDGVYEIRMVYQARVPVLSSGSNWLMTNYPSVYVYATLLTAAPYLKDDSRIPIWEKMYQDAIHSVNNLDWSNASTMTVRGDVTF